MKKEAILSFLTIGSVVMNSKATCIIKEGDTAPQFQSCLTQTGERFSSKEVNQNKSIIVVFFRGTWCSHCIKHMNTFRDNYLELKNNNTEVVFITPETSKFSHTVASQNNYPFPVIYDKDYEIMKSFDVDYQVNEVHYSGLRLFGHDIEKTNGNKDHILPVPATFLINTSGKISYVHFDPDYKKRSNIDDLISMIKK